MAPVSVSAVTDFNEVPISRTVQYKKVTKPLLERQRRARINRCLDELKDLIGYALAEEGGNVAKLEKADVLELTVRHLHKLRRERRLAANPVTSSDRFRAGYTQCAREVSICLAATPGVDISLGTRLMTHLGHALNNMERPSTPSYTPPGSPVDGSTAASSWRPETPLSSGYGSGSENFNFGSVMTEDEEIDVGGDDTKTSLDCRKSVWRPW